MIRIATTLLTLVLLLPVLCFGQEQANQEAKQETQGSSQSTDASAVNTLKELIKDYEDDPNRFQIDRNEVLEKIKRINEKLAKQKRAQALAKGPDDQPPVDQKPAKAAGTQTASTGNGTGGETRVQVKKPIIDGKSPKTPPAGTGLPGTPSPDASQDELPDAANEGSVNATPSTTSPASPLHQPTLEEWQKVLTEIRDLKAEVATLNEKVTWLHRELGKLKQAYSKADQ